MVGVDSLLISVDFCLKITIFVQDVLLVKYLTCIVN